MCKTAGVHHFILLSAVGADPTSSAYLLRVKAAAEAGMRKHHFVRISIFRPSTLHTAKASSAMSRLQVWFAYGDHMWPAEHGDLSRRCGGPRGRETSRAEEERACIETVHHLMEHTTGPDLKASTDNVVSWFTWLMHTTEFESRSCCRAFQQGCSEQDQLEHMINGHVRSIPHWSQPQ